MPRESGASSKHRPRFYLKNPWLLDRPLSRAMTTESYYLEPFVLVVSSHSSCRAKAPTTVLLAACLLGTRGALDEYRDRVVFKFPDRVERPIWRAGGDLRHCDRIHSDRLLGERQAG